MELFEIVNPYVGLIVYCVDTKKHYIITELHTPLSIVDPRKMVKSYRVFNSGLNYRGVFENHEEVTNPVDGDWYRNSVAGACYIYQDGEWILFTVDGEPGLVEMLSFGIQAFAIAKDKPQTPVSEAVPTEPTPPIGLDGTEWSLTLGNIAEGLHAWMTYAIVSKGDTEVIWSEPIRIDGKDGDPGADGTSIEFLYTRTTKKYGEGAVVPDKPTYANYDDPSGGYQQPDYGVGHISGYNEEAWSDTALAVEPDYQTVWMTRRIKKPVTLLNGETVMLWREFSEPVPWSVWGSNGTDGDGVQYVFCLSAYDPDTFATTFNRYDPLHIPQDDISSGAYANAEYIPTINEGQWLQQGGSSAWTDDPMTPTNIQQYVYCCTRKATKGNWATEFNAPQLWAYKAKDGDPGMDGVSPVTVMVLNDNRVIPCYSDGTLILGNHVGAGSGSTFSTAINIALGTDIIVKHGNTDISSECVISAYRATRIAAEKNEFGTELNVISFASASVLQGTITIDIAHETYAIPSVTISFTKALQGSPADGVVFKYYELSVDAQSIMLEYNITENKIVDISPQYICADLVKVTQDGKFFDFEYDAIESEYTAILTAHNENGANIEDSYGNYNWEILGQDFNIAYLISTLKSTPRYFLLKLYDNLGVQLDQERIDVVFTYVGVKAELPQWITQWTGSKAQFNGTDVLAVRAYIGDAPIEHNKGQTDAEYREFTGVLLGSNLTKVKGLPFVDDTTDKEFSGILAVKNLKDAGADNKDAEVTFALDSTTGDAFFKGSVYATSGNFENCTIDESCTIDQCTITNCFITEGLRTNSAKYVDDPLNDDVLYLTFGDGSGQSGRTWYYNLFRAVTNYYKSEGDLEKSAEDLIVASATTSDSVRGGQINVKDFKSNGQSSSIRIADEIEFSFSSNTDSGQAWEENSDGYPTGPRVKVVIDSNGITLLKFYHFDGELIKTQLQIPFNLCKLNGKLTVDDDGYLKIS